MNLHEYQSKRLLKGYKIPVPQGEVASSPEGAVQVAERMQGLSGYAVKAQIHAGGRGKGGGIILAATPREVGQAAEKLLGKPLITHQTGPEGRIVRNVLVEEACKDVVRELYLGIVMDRREQRPVLMASTEGGVEIEETARKAPEKITREYFDVLVGLRPFQARKISQALGVTQQLSSVMHRLLIQLARVYIDLDATLVEINPLIITDKDRILALDAKMNIDDRALPGHPELAQMRDIHEEDPMEYEASLSGLSYINMPGNIGCMVNGAGLAMSTMDIIKLHGGMPANFLDVGGGASKDQVAKAFKLMLGKREVKAVLINIFGGILRCDVLAQGICEAIKEIEVKVPVVVRLEGTNVQEGRKILEGSGLAIVTASDMTEAARKVVQLAGSL
jgi:succinyl-CoA synthetase beta subunit